MSRLYVVQPTTFCSYFKLLKNVKMSRTENNKKEIKNENK